MSDQICMSCSSTLPSELLHLLCDHVLCTSCANQLKTLEPNTHIQPKYKVLCPNCAKATITYDIQNLLFKTKTDHVLLQDQDNSQLKQSCFIEQQPLLFQQSYKEMSYTERINNLTNMSRKQSQTPDIFSQKIGGSSRKGSRGRQEAENRASKLSQRDEDYSSICKQHGENLMFYCQNETKLLCIECMYKHTREHKSHKVLSIKNAANLISRETDIFKQQTKRRIQQISRYLSITKSNKQLLQNKYRESLEIVEEEFDSLKFVLKLREAAVKETLKKVFYEQQKEFQNQLMDLGNLGDCLKQYLQFDIDEIHSKVYFFYSYSQLRDAVNLINLKVHPISPADIHFIQGNQVQQAKKVIDRLFQHPKERQRSRDHHSKDKTRQRYRNLRSLSRGQSFTPTIKNTIVINDEIKHAKKKLLNLQRIKKSSKTNQYLNIYLSNSPGGRQSHKERKSVEVQGNRGTPGRVLISTRVGTKFKRNK